MRKQTETMPNDVISLLALGILDNLSSYIEEYKKEIANSFPLEDALENKDLKEERLDPEFINTIRKKIKDEEFGKELYYKNDVWHQFLVESVEINDCFEKILARIYAGENMDDLEDELVSFIGGMDDRDWVNPHWENYKNRIIKNVCFYCACSIINEEIGAPIQAIQNLLQAAEITGVASRLGPEVGRYMLRGYRHIDVAQISQKLFKKIGKENSTDANIAKNNKYSVKVKFATDKWLEMPEWHLRTAGDTADKLIKEFKKLVPAKDSLIRLISVLKLQPKI